MKRPAEQKKWQQVIPLVERMDYLGAQSNSLACVAVEKLLGLEMPARVKDIRILLAELQRIASHLIWLGTHGMEIGAVSMLFYAVRERELLLNINELIAGFRFFPSYIRIGDPRDWRAASTRRSTRSSMERLPGKIDEFEGLLTKNDIFRRRTEGVASCRRTMQMQWGLVGPILRATAPTTTSGSTSRISATTPTPSMSQPRPRVTLRAVSRSAWRRCASVKICKQAISRITPTGIWACDARGASAEGQGVFGDGSADPALPDLPRRYGAGRRGVFPH